MPATRRWPRLSALPLLLSLALSATLALAGPASSADDQRTVRERKIARAMKITVAQKGDPYVYGADGPNAFDCSGLTQYVFGRVGLSLPRTTDGQYAAVRHIKKKNIRRGDLVYFHSGGNIYHAAVFAGRANGKKLIWHASTPGTNVKRDPIWTSSWYAGTLRRR